MRDSLFESRPATRRTAIRRKELREPLIPAEIRLVVPPGRELLSPSLSMSISNHTPSLSQSFYPRVARVQVLTPDVRHQAYENSPRWKNLPEKIT
jgi:hypothetical protein